MSSQPKQQPAQEQSSADRAIRSPAAVTIFLAVMGISLAADLFSKHAVFKSLLDDPALPQRIENIRAGYGQDIAPADILRSLRLQRRLCPGVRLSLSTNPGVVFGLPMPRLIVGITTLLAVVLVFYFFATSDRSA
ncbi:MAG: hypothetical protein SVT52_01695, partial [Planctomycetota bacterium]|nr:hypothetical protein [Planctomycetota bacterium]